MRSRTSGFVATALVASGLLAFGAPAAAQSSQAGAEDWLEMPVAVLQALDKVTARTTVLPLDVDEPGRYGTLRFRVRACRRRPPTETPESAAFLEISEFKPDEQSVAVFSGWMFASSPALNALEHPVYDIWLLDCRTRSRDNGSSTAPQKSAGSRSAASSSTR